MKKFFALLLITAMVFCLIACGNGSTDTTTEATSDTATESVTDPTVETTEALAMEENIASVEIIADETFSMSVPLDYDAKLAAAIGTVDGTIYSNEMFDITFQLPEDWVFASDAELAAFSGLESEVFDDAAITGLMNAGVEPMVMYARDVNGQRNVNMTISVDDTLSYTSLDDYIAMTAAVLPTIMESAGMTVSGLETKTVTFAGEEFLCITYDLAYSGVAMSQLICCLTGENNYLATISVTAGSAEEIDVILAYFATMS